MERKASVPDIIAARYELRVQSLRQKHFVHVRCDGCRRIVLIPAGELLRHRKSYERFLEVAKDRLCKRCPPRTPLAWSIYRESVLPQIRDTF